MRGTLVIWGLILLGCSLVAGDAHAGEAAARRGFSAEVLRRAEKVWQPKVVRLQLSKINYWAQKGTQAGLPLSDADKTAALGKKVDKCLGCSARRLGCQGSYCTGGGAFGEEFLKKAQTIQSAIEHQLWRANHGLR